MKQPDQTNTSSSVTTDQVIDVNHIQQRLPEGFNCEWVAATPSTQGAVKANSVLIAEHQSAGVGRRGKQWLSPKGRSISLSYRFELPLNAASMAGYQMTAALAVVDTIQLYQPNSAVKLKWPNDLYHNHEKFAGILINLLPKHESTEVIVGIGINWLLDAREIESVDQAICNIPLASITRDQSPKRHEFIAHLIHAINTRNQQFLQHGLGGFLTTWQQHDFLTGKILIVTDNKQPHTGDYLGINQQGQLLLQTQQGIKAFCSGEVSVKAV